MVKSRKRVKDSKKRWRSAEGGMGRKSNGMQVAWSCLAARDGHARSLEKKLGVGGVARSCCAKNLFWQLEVFCDVF